MFAVVAIVLLIVGFGVGYFLGRPASSSGPGPVNNVPRANNIPTVQGWYKNTSISYLDYGSSLNISQPILAFFQLSSPNTPVTGQRNIIDTLPGQPGYTDFWRVFKVFVPGGYVANSIRSFEEAVASGYMINATSTIVNCPVVNPNATINGASASKTLGWYRDRDVSYFDQGSRSPNAGFVVQSAPIWAFFYNTNGSPVAGQHNVIDVRPGDTGYSDLWRVTKVLVSPSYVANTLESASAIMRAASGPSPTVTLQLTSMFVNCPVA